MTDFTEEFLAHMKKNNCPPEEIEVIPDDEIRRFKIQGDKHGKKNGAYQLALINGKAIGWYRNFKEGVTYKFISGNYEYMNPLEYDAHKKTLEKYRWQREQERIKKQDAAAIQAQRLWDESPQAGQSNPYLEKKNIKPYGLRQSGMCLLVPIQDINGKLWNLQRIWPTGVKMYSREAKVDGNFCLIKQGEVKDKIVLVEGYATAASIFESTGIPTACCFQASNLKNVAKEFRKKYPEALMIFGADNDQWTKDASGNLSNTGIKYASEAAASCQGQMVFPDFPATDPERRTDFNDAFMAYGPEHIKLFFN